MLIVVSAPSGAGKTTLCREIRKIVANLAYSVSYTTRSPRPGEIEGQAYEVQGTISASGDIAGRLLVRGRPAGTFHAKMADDEVLEGKLQLGTESAVWLSPSTRGLADEVPGPPGRLGAPD